ncbi:MAG: 2-isopropylmalate synthase [Candidatus Omnitrophica bacterium]|nr:2-isopropylmalate synthase [Candidatus Omnitrophota bacterium]MCM8806774.1 2-isopropylmalate synthase [Candidatus Omnitrophota bacterium]
MERVLIFDTTLRDGEQSPGASLTSDEKLKIALQLEKLGVDIIEAGFPISSPDDAKAVRIIGENVKNCVVCALARCKDEDINSALKALETAQKPRLHLFLATSEIHRKYKLKKAKEEILKIAREKVRYAKKFIEDIEFSPEDASRTEPDFLLEVCKAVAEEGAKTINIPDTVGYAIPEEFGKLIKFLRENLPKEIIISVHCHNDLGLAVSNSLSAILNGARQVECTINGLGERAGNAALEEVVMNLVVRKDYYKVETNIKTEEIFKTSRLVSTLTGIPVQPNKAIVGANAFKHESGIHQDGILKHRLTYEIIDPKMIGIPKSELVLGKHSGRHALRERLKILGFEFEEDKFEKFFEKFKNLAEKKKEIHDVDLIALAEEEIISVNPVYTLEYFHIISGSSTIPSATVRLKKGNKIIEDASRGDGPVDALYKAIDRITKLSPILKEYKITAITGGKDAQGEVTVCIEIDGERVYGKGVSTDIIEASGKAYLNAINFYLLRSNIEKKKIKGT